MTCYDEVGHWYLRVEDSKGVCFQVHELSDAFAKTSCSCIEDWDYEQDEKVKVSYSLKQRLKILLMKLKMKMYELMY